MMVVWPTWHHGTMGGSFGPQGWYDHLRRRRLHSYLPGRARAHEPAIDRRGVMAAPVRIIGSYISPYVRKVLVCLRTKGVPYEIDPIIPFVGDDRFSQLSPLRRIPVYT